MYVYIYTYTYTYTYTYIYIHIYIYIHSHIFSIFDAMGLQYLDYMAKEWQMANGK